MRLTADEVAGDEVMGMKVRELSFSMVRGGGICLGARIFKLRGGAKCAFH